MAPPDRPLLPRPEAVTDEIAPRSRPGTVSETIIGRYQDIESQIGAVQARRLETQIMMATLSWLWPRHLAEMDNVRAGLNLHGDLGGNPIAIWYQEGNRFLEELVRIAERSYLDQLLNCEVHAAPVSLPPPEALVQFPGLRSLAVEIWPPRKPNTRLSHPRRGLRRSSRPLPSYVMHPVVAVADAVGDPPDALADHVQLDPIYPTKSIIRLGSE